MHGDKSQKQRERALAQFENGDIDTLVATDVAARGIDVAGISHVINFDPPADTDTYTHRVGRTGRAGRSGEGVTFVGAEQARDVGKIATDLGIHQEFARTGFLRTQAGGAKPRSDNGAPRTTPTHRAGGSRSRSGRRRSGR
jgi:ATP-dependent RNA helicase DeaD/ATP-dependent RNA helicase RhlE